MPAPKYPLSSLTQPVHNHWYNRLPPRPVRRRRYGSSVFNNMWNAWSNWGNAIQDNPAGLLSTMRTQIDNLKQMIDASGLYGNQKQLVQQLIAETKQALDALNPALLSQQVNRTSSIPVPMYRTANEQSAISSNAKAALGCMAYLQDDNLFPGCALTYQYIRERLEQIFRLMDGEYQVADIVSVRQQPQTALAPQQRAPMNSNDGSTTPYIMPLAGATALNSSQMPPAAPAQGYVPNPTTIPGTSGVAQSTVPSPVEGLKLESPPWEGRSNTNADGHETVGSGQDWFSLYGTTIEKFAARCSRWLHANGGGPAVLTAHLQASGVPQNVIGQVMAYVWNG